MLAINFENDVRKLTKEQLGAELNIDEREVRNSKKDELVKSFIHQNNDAFSRKRFYRKYAQKFSVHPTKVQELFQITPTERKRWTKEGKLKVSYFDSFQKWGKTLEYPMYDAVELSKISNETITKWREEYKNKVNQNRKNAAAKSLQTKKRKQKMRLNFYEKEWKSLLKKWFKEDGMLGATLQLSFWTMWISRWAKEYQSKAYRARTNYEKYNERKEQYYEVKNEAISLLIRSPYVKPSFYRPESPNKISNIHFCEKHYSEWCQLREFDYLGKWDYFTMCFNDIKTCTDCTFHEDVDYYSLYYLSVSDRTEQDFQFSFHIPYPIGKFTLPPIHELERVHHDEQEGIFRFGRALFENERIIFTEKEVKKNFQEAMAKFELYFPNKKSLV